MRWYDDGTVLRQFATALVNASYFDDDEDNENLLLFLTKPQKFNDEFKAWETAGFPTSDSDDGWEDFTNEILSEDSDG